MFCIRKIVVKNLGMKKKNKNKNRGGSEIWEREKVNIKMPLRCM